MDGNTLVLSRFAGAGVRARSVAGLASVQNRRWLSEIEAPVRRRQQPHILFRDYVGDDTTSIAAKSVSNNISLPCALFQG